MDKGAKMKEPQIFFNALADFCKSLVRPYIIFVFTPIIGLMLYQGRASEIPYIMGIVLGLYTIEYSAERMIKRWKEKE